MPTSPSPRPQLRQSRSTGWAWPHLVDKREQQEKASQPKKNNAGLKQFSAASSLRNLQSSRDLSTLREEQSAPTSPTHISSTPEGSMSGHHGETSANANAMDDQYESVDVKQADELMPGQSSHEAKNQHGVHGGEVADSYIKAEVGEDAVHPDDSLPGTFPVTPAAVATRSDRFPGLAQVGLLPTAEESGTASAPSRRFPGLAQVGLLPAAEQPSVAVEPDTKRPCDCGDLCQCPPPCGDQEPRSTAEEHTTEPATPVVPPRKDPQVSVSSPHRPLPPPLITIQRPSNSDISEVGDYEATEQLKEPSNPQTIDSVLAEERQGTESLPLQQRLEEERRLTSELTQAERQGVIQKIATDIAAVPNPVTQPGEVTMSTEVKKRMQIRRAIVRSPMLKLLLGRQLAGPAKEALKMRALGKAVPVTGVSTLLNTTVDGCADSPSPVLEMGSPRMFGYPPLQKRLAGHFAASDSCSFPSQPETPESQQLWYGGAHRSTVTFRGSRRLGQTINVFTWPDFY